MKDFPSEVNAAYRVAIIISVSMIVSLGIYAAVVEFLSARGGLGEPVAAVDIVRYAVVGLAVALLLIVRVVRGALLQKSARDDLASLLGRLIRSAIVTGALCEVPGVLGLVLFFLTAQTADFYLLAGMSIIMWAIYFPRRSHWQEWLGSAWRNDDGTAAGMA